VEVGLKLNKADFPALLAHLQIEPNARPPQQHQINLLIIKRLHKHDLQINILPFFFVRDEDTRINQLLQKGAAAY
jgi:hypothetical protein